MSPGINDGIMRLISHGAIARVSVLANSNYLEYRLSELLASKVEISFHLCFTDGLPLCSGNEIKSLTSGERFLSLGGFLWRIVQRRISKQDLKAECERQICRLRSLGISTALLEAHHNVHLIPVVFSAVKDLLVRHGFNRVRGIADFRHRSGLLLTLLLSLKLKLTRDNSWKIEFVRCLHREDIETAARFTSRVESSRNLKLVVHPSIVMDFDSIGCRDRLRDQRVREFKLIDELSLRAASTTRPMPSPSSAP